MRKVVHFEIPADDLERAKTFYSSVFDWDLQTVPVPGGEYTTVTTTPVDQQTQMPTEPAPPPAPSAPTARDERWPAPVITVAVEDIDQALQEIEAQGGGTVTPRTAMPGMGAFAYFKDPEGNVLGLWETSA